jgi:predicted DCC family thiol-disulfide oxidoreductase YuxK
MADTKLMTSKYDGKCGYCGKRIEAGDWIEYNFTTRKVSGCAYCDKVVKAAEQQATDEYISEMEVQQERERQAAQARAIAETEARRAAISDSVLGHESEYTIKSVPAFRRRRAYYTVKHVSWKSATSLFGMQLTSDAAIDIIVAAIIKRAEDSDIERGDFDDGDDVEAMNEVRMARTMSLGQYRNRL